MSRVIVGALEPLLLLSLRSTRSAVATTDTWRGAWQARPIGRTWWSCVDARAISRERAPRLVANARMRSEIRKTWRGGSRAHDRVIDPHDAKRTAIAMCSRNDACKSVGGARGFGPCLADVAAAWTTRGHAPPERRTSSRARSADRPPHREAVKSGRRHPVPTTKTSRPSQMELARVSAVTRAWNRTARRRGRTRPW